jgi:signal transduction histidine kinase
MYPRRRWAVVIGSILAIAVVEGLSDSVLDSVLPFPLDSLLVITVVATVAIVAAWFAFRLIDRLTVDVIARHEALRARNAALRAVYDLSLAVAGQKDPDEVLASLLDHARNLLRVDAALLVLRGPEGEVRLRSYSAGLGVLLPAAETRTAQVSGSDPAEDLARFLSPRYHIGLEAPVGYGETTIGVIGVATLATRRFSDSEAETLTALATQAGLAIEAARLREELRAVAVQAERERIAREMHDGLAQVLAYVNTKSQAVEELLSDGRVAEAGRQMAELATAARSMYVDVREAILSLSPPILPERGLSRALEEYAAAFAESSKIAVRYKATPEAARIALKPEVGAEVFGVAREALTNVRKHARASRVSIGLSSQDDELLLRIADDGIGFDAQGAAAGPEKWPHFGLAGMRERAESIGGRIEWHSEPGSGSVVELRVPAGPGGPGGLNGPVGPPDGAGSRLARHQTVQSTVPTHSEAD